MCCVLWKEKKLWASAGSQRLVWEDYSVKGTGILSNKHNLQRKLIKSKYVELFCNRHFKNALFTKSVLG